MVPLFQLAVVILIVAVSAVATVAAVVPVIVSITPLPIHPVFCPFVLYPKTPILTLLLVIVTVQASFSRHSWLSAVSTTLIPLLMVLHPTTTLVQSYYPHPFHQHRCGRRDSNVRETARWGKSSRTGNLPCIAGATGVHLGMLHGVLAVIGHSSPPGVRL